MTTSDGHDRLCQRELEHDPFFCEECERFGVCETCGKATAGNEEFPFDCDACAITKRDNYDPTPWEVDYSAPSAAEVMDRAYDAHRKGRL